MTSIDDETSDENDNDPLNLSHTKVSRIIKQENAIESTTPMDIGIMQTIGLYSTNQLIIQFDFNLDRIDSTQQVEGNICNGHEDMLQDVSINDSQSEHGTALNLSVLASVYVGPAENPILQFKEEKEAIVNENGDAELKENVAQIEENFA